MTSVKRINGLFIFLFVMTFFLSCRNESFDFMYGVYCGTHTSSVKQDVSGTKKESPGFEICVEIRKDSLLISGGGFKNTVKYRTTTWTSDLVNFVANVKHGDKDVIYNFRFNKKEKILILADMMGTGNDLVLHSKKMFMEEKVNEYAVFKLTTDVSKLTENEKKMIPILVQVADLMDEIYWKQSFGDKQKLFSEITDEAVKKFAIINYGPWDRLDGNKSFIEKYGEKPKGAGFYPTDMTKEEFDKIEDVNKTSWYTVIRRNSDKSLNVVWYHQEYKEQIEKAAGLLKQASELAEDAGLKKYLELRSAALLSDDYLESDLAWMDMKDNKLDMVVGSIENYEDALYGYKAAQSGQILVKDKQWTEKLKRYGVLMPKLQESLPVDKAYKKEKPGVDADMNVYDVIYYAGDCNSGSKNIAINLPNDERVHAKKGSRKLQLRNAMQAKFEKILVPISNLMMVEEQRKNVKFEAFFENVMFHEVAHGLGVKKTIDQKSTVRDALKDYYSAIEEAKADILGLFFVSKLTEMGEMKGKDIHDNFVTFFAGIFRSVRFGVSSAHGKANMLTFYWFQEKGAFSRDEKTGLYKVNFDKIADAVNSLGEKLVVTEGDGNYSEAKRWVDQKGQIDASLQKDLDRIGKAGIPRDIIFEQGLKALGL